MNRKAMLVILVMLTLLALVIDPILAAIFTAMWIIWFSQHKKELDDA